MGHEQPPLEDPHDPHWQRGDRGSRGPDYRMARIGAASAFTATVIILLLLDALRADYVVDHVVLTLLVGTILGLLGLEAAKIIRGSGR